jgi:hypothetical protein
MDFLGVGVTSNYNQSNSWAPRIRQAYFTYDNTEWGFHFLGGQAWSLLTQNQVGITPRKENIPLTIDHSYVVGFDYTRNWQLRLVKDFGSWASSVSGSRTSPNSFTPALGLSPTAAMWAAGSSISQRRQHASRAAGRHTSHHYLPLISSVAAFDPGQPL